MSAATRLVAGEADLTAALDRLGESDALRAFLDDALVGLRASVWPDVAWRFSRLTGDGYPVELSFTSADGEPRFTAEVAGAEVPNDERLDRALRLLPEPLGAGDQVMAERLRALQAGAELRWGAWFGGRLAGGARRGKVYVESPRVDARAADADAFAAELLGTSPSAALERPVPLRMVGWDPSAGRVELYFRPGPLDDASLSRLLALAGQATRLHDVLDVVADACETEPSRALPGASYGCSFSVPLDASLRPGAVVVSVVAFAHAMFGYDRYTRAMVSNLARRRGWDLTGYEAVSEPLATSSSWPTAHGMVTFVLAPGKPPQFHVGLRPPGG